MATFGTKCISRKDGCTMMKCAWSANLFRPIVTIRGFIYALLNVTRSPLSKRHFDDSFVP